jgi:ABC-2 type transport system permease protein
MKKSFYTVYIFAKLNAKRFFRDKLAIFFTIAFPLIFLVIFGTLFNNDNNVSFKVGLINESSSNYSKQFAEEATNSSVLNVNQEVNNLDDAQEKMKRNELDATILLPPDFGSIKEGNNYPSGQATVYYSQNSSQAGQTLASILQNQFNAINSEFVDTSTPFTVTEQPINQNSLTSFDYTFAGMLGFAIVALGIFGPVNVFPELKKQGILRRLHTTPLKVWQYFVANVISQGFIGLIALAVLFAFSIVVFDLNMQGNYLEFIIFALFSIFTIYGIGLAIGGWAKNERQAAPLANLIVFPMIFLSGTFFPRFLMPEWLQGITSYFPLTPVNDGIRLIVTEGKSLIDVAPQLGLMAIWAVVIYIIAFRIFRWE